MSSWPAVIHGHIPECDNISTQTPFSVYRQDPYANEQTGKFIELLSWQNSAKLFSIKNLTFHETFFMEELIYSISE